MAYILESKVKYSCVMINTPKYLTDLVLTWVKQNIKSDWLDPDEVNDPNLHVTIKYGIHTKDPNKISKLIHGFGIISISLRKISMFRSDPKYNVLKIDVHSPELHRLNRLISENLKVTDTHPEYHPHITLAYLKKDYGKEFVGSNNFYGLEFTSREVYFSIPNSNSNFDFSTKSIIVL